MSATRAKVKQLKKYPQPGKEIRQFNILKIAVIFSCRN